MDFHTLSRKQLQALCKKNKIPANLTNLAMADALKSLHIVEGIDEFLQPSQSETTQSSIELPVMSEVTSPYVPPSGVRSTRKSQFESRKKQVNEVPESQGGPLMDVLMTPAPRGDTGHWKRVKEDSSKVRRAYSTRRSVRLAERHTKVLNEEDNDMVSEISKQLPGEIGCLNLNEVSEVGGSDEMCGVSVSAQNQDITIGEEIKLESSAEEEKSGHFEMDFRDATSGRAGVDSERGIECDENKWEKETEARSDEEAAIGFEASEIEHHFEEIEGSSAKEEGSGFELVEEKCDKTEDPRGEPMVIPLNLNHKQEIEFGIVSELGKERHDQIENLVHQGTFESSNLVQQRNGEFEDTMDGLSSEFGKGFEGNAAGNMKNIAIENRDPRDGYLNAALMKLNLQQITGKVASENACKSELLDHSDILAESNTQELGETAGSSENGEQGKGETQVVAEHLPTSGFIVSGSQPVVVPELTCEKSVSNTSSKPVFSDNKENIVSGKLVLVKQKIKKESTVGKGEKNWSLDELSIRKLSKMLKEKLEISKKPREDDEHGRNHHSRSQVMPRSALQTLPED